MAVHLLGGHEVADLCLGKPPLRRSLSISTTVGAALAALKAAEDTHISVWSCDHSNNSFDGDDDDNKCVCIGKVCMVDIICYLCKEENLSSSSPTLALKAPVSVLLSKVPADLVKHVEPSSSLLEAIDIILEGAQNLVVPIKNTTKTNPERKQLQKSSSTSPTTTHNGREFCWLTQEDIMRFLLSSIGIFYPIPSLSVEDLNLISTEFLTLGFHTPMSSALEVISQALMNQTSIAVVDDDGLLIGEISPLTLACSDETVAAAVATLSAGELMVYIDYGNPPEDIVKVVKERLKEREFEGMFEEFENLSSSLSSTMALQKSGRCSSYSAKMVRKVEDIVCHPWSSLVAVIIQAIAHRVNYVWVVDKDCSLAGIVTFSDMLEVFRDHLDSTAIA